MNRGQYRIRFPRINLCLLAVVISKNGSKDLVLCTPYARAHCLTKMWGWLSRVRGIGQDTRPIETEAGLCFAKDPLSCKEVLVLLFFVILLSLSQLATAIHTSRSH